MIIFFCSSKELSETNIWGQFRVILSFKGGRGVGLRYCPMKCNVTMVENGAFRYKIACITICQEILNLKRHQNCNTGSRVTAILLNRWTFPIGPSGEASRWSVCYQRGLPHLASFSIPGFLYWNWQFSFFVYIISLQAFVNICAERLNHQTEVGNLKVFKHYQNSRMFVL